MQKQQHWYTVISRLPIPPFLPYHHPHNQNEPISAGAQSLQNEPILPMPHIHPIYTKRTHFPRIRAGGHLAAGPTSRGFNRQRIFQNEANELKFTDSRELIANYKTNPPNPKRIHFLVRHL
ncbi:MAG: hypothetical protein ACYC7E_06280 [Armatimonadota bacterium]